MPRLNCRSPWNLFRSWSAPAGTTVTELAAASEDAPGVAAAPSTAVASAQPGTAMAGWPSYNNTLTSQCLSALSQIDTKSVSKLKVLCSCDTRQYGAFEPGLIMLDGALIGTTEHYIFSLDPVSCHEKWRIHEDYTPANRGAAFSDGLLFRGTQNGRVLAYDATTGKRNWETVIADRERGESAPAAPIAWNGLVFISNAGGDNKGAKDR